MATSRRGLITGGHVFGTRRRAADAGLKVIDVIGTFINPWFTSQTLFTASDAELLGDGELYEGLQLLGRALRRRGYRDPFSEVLLVCERA